MSKALEFMKGFLENEAAKVEASNTANAKDEAKKIRAQYEKGEIAKHRTFRDRVSTDAGLNAVIRVMRTECDVPSNYYDNDQRWFVMRNCVLDLDAVRNGGWAVYEHDPSRPVTKFFDADFLDKDERVNLKHWDEFLRKSVPCPASRLYLQKVTGAAFMGESKLRTILNLHGPPGSGKSVFLGTMFKLGKEGAGYVCMPDSKSIIKVSGQNFEQDSFKGRRVIGVSEPAMNDPIDNEFVKKYTGDDWVETRTLNVKSAGWVPQGVIFVASNKALKINTRDKAIVERVQMIEFPISFDALNENPDHRPVEGLEDKLMDDRQRILEWIIAGMLMFVKDRRKLTPPDEVRALSSDVVTEASTALRWVAEYVDEDLLKIDFQADPKYYIPVKDAYARYQNWAIQSGEKALTARFFKQDIENRYDGCVKAEGDSQYRFRGITVTAEFRRINEGNGFTAVNKGF
jgi:phage/plasmid-associated DNA primase